MWHSILAGASLAVSSRGTTGFALLCGFVSWLYECFSRENGVRPMLKNWRALLKSAAIGLGIWLAVVAWNSSQAYKVFSQPQQLDITWLQRTGGLEVIPGATTQTITPAYLRDRKEYTVELDSSKGNIVLFSFAVLFQLPFPVEGWKADLNGVGGLTFLPVSSFPVVIASPNAQISGPRLHRQYMLSVPYMPPTGKIRMLLLMNHNPQATVIQIGKPTHKPPPVFPSMPLRGALYEYLHVYISILYGGQVLNRETYAPLTVSKEKTISLGAFSQPPKHLHITTDVVP